MTDSRPLRIGFLLAGLATLVVALAFFDEAPWAVDLWPWEDSPLSYTFIASILAAIALPIVWIAVTGELAAVLAGAVDLAITYGLVTVYLLTLEGDAGQPDLWPHIAVFGFGFLAMLGTIAWSRRIPWRSERPMPAPLRASFGVFAAVLTAAGLALMFGADIFPWEVRAESSFVFGAIYLGAAAYFAVGFMRPRFGNAAGQLIGFLAYDLVLLGPFIDRFSVAEDGELLSLVVYTAFLLYSAALAVHYLWIERLWAD